MGTENYTYEAPTKLKKEDYQNLQKKYPTLHFTNTFSSNVSTSLDVTQHIEKIAKLSGNNE